MEAQNKYKKYRNTTLTLNNPISLIFFNKIRKICKMLGRTTISTIALDI